MTSRSDQIREMAARGVKHSIIANMLQCSRSNVAHVLNMDKNPPRISGPRRRAAELIVSAVAQKHKVDMQSMMGNSRRRCLIAARWEAMYRLRMEGRYTFFEMAALFGRDPSTVQHGVKSYVAQQALSHTRSVYSGGGVVTGGQALSTQREAVE